MGQDAGGQETAGRGSKVLIRAIILCLITSTARNVRAYWRGQPTWTLDGKPITYLQQGFAIAGSAALQQRACRRLQVRASGVRWTIAAEALPFRPCSAVNWQAEAGEQLWVA